MTGARRAAVEFHRGFSHPSEGRITYATSGFTGPYLRVGRFRLTCTRRATRYKARGVPDRVVWSLIFYFDSPKRGRVGVEGS